MSLTTLNFRILNLSINFKGTLTKLPTSVIQHCFHQLHHHHHEVEQVVEA